MGKPTICIGENKGADQLRGNREADQRLCFRYSDSTIPPLLNSKISSETTLLAFPRGGTYSLSVFVKMVKASETHMFFCTCSFAKGGLLICLF